MSGDDSIADTLLGDDPRERAELLERRLFPWTVTGKIRVCVATLFTAVLLFPTLFARRGLIRTLETRQPDASLFSTDIATVVLAGVIFTFLFGVILLRQRTLLFGADLTVAKARRLIRIEDLLMTLTVTNGVLFVAVPFVLALIGLAFPESIAGLYESEVRVYRASAVAIDARVTSLTGALSGGILAGLEWHGRPDR